MRRFVFAISAFMMIAAAGQVAAVTLGPIPADRIVTYGGAEWVWAAPCNMNYESCPFSWAEQTQYGWRIPTAQEVADSITANLTAFIAAFQSPLGTVSYAGDTYLCAAEWFTDLGACQPGDALAGYITNLGSTNFGAESFVIRDITEPVLPSVPVPASLPLIGGAMALMAALRRRSRD